MHCQSLPDRPEYSFFTCAVAFIESVLKEHIIKGHNEFGVILWGTQENSNSLGSTAGIVEWLPLLRPTCARIIQLGKLAATGMLCAGNDVSRTLSCGSDAQQLHPHYRAANATLPGNSSVSCVLWLVSDAQIARCRRRALCRATSASATRCGARARALTRAAYATAARRSSSSRATPAPAAP
jgi:hypothetical protein